MNKTELPVLQVKNRYQQHQAQSNKTIFCFAWQEDLDQAYAFYCARYKNISYNEFMHLGFLEFKKKLGSIPKDEPLYNIIKSRTIKIGKIKDKEEKKYWREMKRINEIPSVYLPTKELDMALNSVMKNVKKII